MRTVAGVVLAAGGSTRFGRPKQLLDWGGKPLVAHVADVALDAGLDPVIVVVGCEAERVRQALGERPVVVATNWRWEEGLSTSVQIGLAMLPPRTEAAVFLQCDQPLVGPSLIGRLVARWQETDALIVHPTHGGRRATPVLFARPLFAELAAVRGDEGGRSLIVRYADRVATVEVEEPDLLTDVDTEGQYARLVETLEDTEPTSMGQRAEALLRRIRYLIIDMDGVLWRGDTPMPGLKAFFDLLRARHIGFVLATNNASKRPERYVERLARLGVTVDRDAILTSAQATAAFLAGREPEGTPVFVIGGEGLRSALSEAGFRLTEEGARYVVVGWDPDLTWRKLARATLLIRAGAGFIGTNPDRTFPSEEGLVPGNGAQLAAIEAATGVSPLIIGKPKPWLYREAMRRMGATPHATAVIGDRLDTDIAGARRLGLPAILVLSGITQATDLARSALRPDLVCADIGELTRLWKGIPRVT